MWTFPKAKPSVHLIQESITHLAFLKLMSDFALKIELRKYDVERQLNHLFSNRNKIENNIYWMKNKLNDYQVHAKK